ncbi:MAG: iron chelate uptake ABC transporter family permease subunit, partial [Chromatiales bacterium]
MKPGLALSLLALIVAVMAAAAALVGPYPISGEQIASAVLGRLGGQRDPSLGQVETILFSIRLPRIGAALLVGAALAAAGAVYQGLFRNPLVSPDILGVSTGAGLGAAAGIFLSLPVIAIQGLAFATGLA